MDSNEKKCCDRCAAPYVPGGLSCWDENCGCHRGVCVMTAYAEPWCRGWCAEPKNCTATPEPDTPPGASYCAVPAPIQLLLADVRDAFAKEGEAPVANMFAEKVDVEIASADLVKALVAIEGRPWAEMGKSGKPLTQNKLARMLAVPGVRIAPDHIDPKTRVRGYKLSQFEEALSRYLPSEGVSNRSTVQNAANTGNGGERGLSSPPHPTPLPGDRHREAVRARNREALQRFEVEIRERARQH